MSRLALLTEAESLARYVLFDPSIQQKCVEGLDCPSLGSRSWRYKWGNQTIREPWKPALQAAQ